MMVVEIFYALCAFLGGILLGYAFFVTLRLNVTLYTSGRAGRAIILHVLRTVFSVAAFIGFAALGAIPLVTSLAGFLLARHIVIRSENNKQADTYNLSQVYQL